MSTAAAAVLATVETRAKQHHTADPPRRGPSGSTITAARGLSKALKRMETAGAGRRLIFGARPLAGSAGDDYLFRAVVMTGIPVRSPTYDLFERTMRRRRQILCVYDGYPRELCPIVLGHRRGQEVALTYQFAGKSSGRLPPGGQWKCLRLSKVSEVRLGSAMDRGAPVTGTCSAKPVSKSSISTSIRKVLTFLGVADAIRGR